METTTAIALPDTFKPEVFKSLIDKAPDVYIESKSRVEKALAVGEKLLGLAEQSIKDHGKITDDIDARLNKYMVNIRTASKEINDQRAPITSMFLAVSKLYTGLEGNIDPNKGDSIPAKVQKIRNDYAAQKAKEEREAEQARQRKLLVEKERITITTESESKLKLYFLSYLDEQQKALVNLFEGVTLDTYEAGKLMIEKFSETYTFSHFENFKPQVFPINLTAQEVSTIVTNVKAGKFDTFSIEFRETIQGLKEVFMDKLPSKLNELKQIAESGRIDSELLAFQAQQRQAEDAKRLEEETAAKRAQVTSQAQTNSSAMAANLLFDMQSETAATTKPQAKEGYSITVSHPVGYQLIAAFYFEKEGIKETVEKLEKKTLGQMKAFCEKWAVAHEEKLQSPFLTYKETFKALTK